MPPSPILEDFCSCVELFCTIFGFGNQTVYYTTERLVLKKNVALALKEQAA